MVARQPGKVCVVNCAGLTVDAGHISCHIGKAGLNEGDIITLEQVRHWKNLRKT